MYLPLAEIWIPAADELKLFGPELAMIGTIVAMMLAPLAVGRSRRCAALIALPGCLVALLLTAVVAGEVVRGGRGSMAPANMPPMLVADLFTVFFKMFVLLLLNAVIWLWMIGETEAPPTGVAGRPGGTDGPEFCLLLLTSALGMMLMVGTLNLLMMIVAMETTSLPSYALAAGNKRSRRGAEAALKYVLFGATSAAIMVYGVSLLYGRFGTLDVPTIAGRIAADPGRIDALLWTALLAVGVGLAFKIAAVPMHLWCPDVFEGAPIEVTTWLSVASKAAGLGLLLRLVHTFTSVWTPAGLSQPLTWAVGIIAAVTCTVGNLAALRQESVKRILAYSSIAHAGYMMMTGAILTGQGGTLPVNPAVAALITYLFMYLLMNVGAFGVTALLSWRTGSDRLLAFTGLGRRAPWLALPMAVCLFSLVGLPPLGGFAAKWYLLLALGQAAHYQGWLWGLILVAVGNTALSLYYYVRVIRQMYLADEPQLQRLHIPFSGYALVNACALALLLFGTVWFNWLGTRAEALACNLYARM